MVNLGILDPIALLIFFRNCTDLMVRHMAVSFWQNMSQNMTNLTCIYIYIYLFSQTFSNTSIVYSEMSADHISDIDLLLVVRDGISGSPGHALNKGLHFMTLTVPFYCHRHHVYFFNVKHD